MTDIVMENINAGLAHLAGIAVGLPVAPANWVGDAGANLRNRHADTLVIRHVTGAGRKIAQLVRLAGNPGKTAENWL